MRISSNPLPVRSTLVSPDHQKDRARIDRQDVESAATKNEKAHFPPKAQPVTKSEYVSRSRSYSDHINDLPGRSQNAIRSYQDNSATSQQHRDSAELAGIDLYV